MIVWILMILDLIAITALTFVHYDLAFSIGLLIISGIYLILKGIVFRDIMSFTDLASGVYILLVAAFTFSSFIYYIILLWFIYKFSSTILGSL